MLDGLSAVVPQTKLQVIVTRLCRTCRFSEIEGKDRVCRFDPPKMSFIPLPMQQRVPGPNGPMMVQGIEVRPVSGFPVVQNEQWCGKWERKVAE